MLLLSCGNGRKNEAPIDGGHGIGIDTATVNEIKHYEDSIRTKESANESTTSMAPSTSSPDVPRICGRRREPDRLLLKMVSLSVLPI